MDLPSLADVLAAERRIAGAVVRTPTTRSDALSELTGADVWVKPEYLQRTGSFKERGARNALALLDPERRARGVVAASAGNHALALSYHGRELGIPVTVVMPVHAPLVKRARCASFGARVMLSGEDIQQAKGEADRLSGEEGLTYVHGFDGFEVIAGQGTIGLEILRDVPDADAIVVPIGGGGLVAGIGLALQSAEPRPELIGVEPEGAPTYTAALREGAPVSCPVWPTLADGLAVPTVGERAFALAREAVDRTVLVSEEAIAISILRILELERGVVEGGGAAPLAALLGPLRDLRGKRVVLVLCGGNIDPAVLGRIIERGLVLDGRLARFRARISDRPGGLARFTALLADTGASVRQIEHERAFASADVSRVLVDATIETRGAEHLEEVLGALDAAGFEIVKRTSAV